jgi:acyl-coenzyme A thioesterase PaaI-like protein
VVSTVEYKTNFMNPALLNDQLKAVSKVEQKGKRLIIVSCDVFAVNRKDILIAKALGTFNSYDASKAGY